MKINLNNKLRRSTVRTLDDFSRAIFFLMEKKKVEDITIGEICNHANYPRSTFYNYFEDIYDLLDYCWFTVTKEMDIADYASIEHDERTTVLFEHIYEYMMSMEETIDKILRHNNENGQMVQSIKKFMKQKIQEIFLSCPEKEIFKIPYDIAIEHYSNTFELILGKCFLQKDRISKEQAVDCLNFLLGTLERNK